MHDSRGQHCRIFTYGGNFLGLEGVYLLESKWSGREDLNLRPLVPNQIPDPIESCLNLLFLSD
jgi:hypothetical protein